MLKQWSDERDNIFSTKYVHMYLFSFCSLALLECVQDLLPYASIVFCLAWYHLFQTLYMILVFGPELSDRVKVLNDKDFVLTRKSSLGLFYFVLYAIHTISVQQNQSTTKKPTIFGLIFFFKYVPFIIFGISTQRIEKLTILFNSVGKFKKSCPEANYASFTIGQIFLFFIWTEYEMFSSTLHLPMNKREPMDIM